MGTGVSKLVNVVSSSFTSERVTIPSSVADNQDLVREILTKLPMKSVARFRCVSKEWFAFLNQIRPSCLIYTHSVEIGHHHHEFLLVRDAKTLSRVESPEIILDGSFKSIYIAGSSNGLVCLQLLEDKTKRERIIIWNPVTKQYRQLPKAPLCFEGENNQKMNKPLLGFGCIQGHGTDIDYKVVRISLIDGLVTQVFTRSAKSWRVIKQTDLSCFMFLKSCSITLNGVLYFTSWNPSKGGNVRNGLSFCSFNLHDEVFHNTCTPVPSEILDKRLDSSSVSSVVRSPVTLRELFAWSDLVATYRRDGDSQQYDVSVMTANWKWTKQAITMKPPADGWCYGKPYGVWDSLVILDKWLRTPSGGGSDEHYLCTYDLRNQKETMLTGPEAVKSSKSRRRCQGVSFVESQVSV